MNRRALTTEQPAALEKAQQLFASWRKSKIGRSRIPGNLWQTAADLYHIRGMSINKIARGEDYPSTRLRFLVAQLPYTFPVTLGFSQHPRDIFLIQIEQLGPALITALWFVS